VPRLAPLAFLSVSLVDALPDSSTHFVHRPYYPAIPRYLLGVHVLRQRFNVPTQIALAPSAVPLLGKLAGLAFAEPLVAGDVQVVDVLGDVLAGFSDLGIDRLAP
jgi:hypothetical protein